MIRLRRAFPLVLLAITAQLGLGNEKVGIHYMSEYAKKINKHCGWDGNSDSQCYAWKPEGRNKESATVIADEQDRTEGNLSYRFVLNHGWSRWVLEMKDGKTVDYSPFDRLVFDLKSVEAKYWDSFDVVFDADGKVFTKALKDLGFKSDGEWHRCWIPIADITKAGIDTTKVKKLFQIAWGGGPMDGHEFKLDNLYLEKGQPPVLQSGAVVQALKGGRDAGDVGIHYMSEYARKINRHCGWDNNSDSQCYAWKPEGSDKESATVMADNKNKVEGKLSYRFVLNHGWSRWVLEMKPGKTVDYSQFDRLTFYVNSEEAKYWDSFNVIVGSAHKEFTKPLKDIGFKPDGKWHKCEIPISEIAAADVDTTKITKLFQIAWGGGVLDGHEFHLDDLHLGKGKSTTRPGAALVDDVTAVTTRNPFEDMTGYQLVWSDEFNTDGPPDPKNWSSEEGFCRNNEAQWYQKENVFCKDGKLIFEARRVKKPNPNYKAGSKDWRTNREFIEYTSGSILTKGLHSWKFGRFEIRAKIDTRLGVWPAIWLLGETGEWPSNGEIDIMEYYRGAILANTVWGTKKRWVGAWDSVKKTLKTLPEKWVDEFHIWRMDWNEQTIKIYVDGLLLNETDLSRTINPTDRGPKNPFHQHQYLLLNLAVGGNNGGDPSASEFPARYEVDYVRVYQKK